MCMLYLDLKISKDSSSSLSTVCLTTAIWNVNHIKKVSLFWKSCRTCIRSTFEGVLIKKQKQREMKTLTSAVVQGTKIWKLHVFLRSSQASPQWQSVCKVSKRASLFVASLEQLCSLLFPLDHIRYSGWIPVFIHELKLLDVSDPGSYTISQLQHGPWATLWQEKLVQILIRLLLIKHTTRIIKSSNQELGFQVY